MADNKFSLLDIFDPYMYLYCFDTWDDLRGFPLARPIDGLLYTRRTVIAFEGPFLGIPCTDFFYDVRVNT